jgi:hypothetical protein
MRSNSGNVAFQFAAVMSRSVILSSTNQAGGTSNAPFLRTSNGTAKPW